MSTEQAGDPLKVFRFRQQALTDLLRRQHAVAVGLENTALIEAAANLEERVATSTFKVLVVGEFKRGKSTVINAMLGQRVLPAVARPCTAVVSEVKYASKRHAVLHPRDGSPAFEIPVEELASYITIEDDDETRVNPYQLAEVYWPLDLCRDGVEIVDSPGLNEDGIRDQVTGGYLARADAIVYVLAAVPPFSETERRYLENYILPLGHEDVFFLYNRIDQVAEEERADLMASATRRLNRIAASEPGQPGSTKEARIFFINARGALEGRLNGDTAMVASSALPRFEMALRLFLTHEKGRVKLMTPIRELRRRLADSRDLIRERDRMYDQELQSLVDRYEAERPKLEALEQRRQVIIGGLHSEIRLIETVVEDAAREFLGPLAGQCPDWADQAEIESRITFTLRGTEEQVDTVAAEVMTVLSDRLQAEIRAWQSAVLGPLLDKHLNAIQDRLDQDVTSFLDQVRDIRLAIAGADPVKVDAKSETVLEQVITGAADQLLMNAMLGAAGAKADTGSILRAALPQIGVLLGGLLLSFSPVGILTAMLGAGALQNVTRLSKLNTSVKRQVGEGVADQLGRSVPDQARAFGRQVGDHLRSLSERVDQGLSAQTETVREQVNATIQDKKAGEDKVARRRTQLRDLMAEIELIEQERADLADQIVAG